MGINDFPKVITIDPRGAKDLDDAISATPLPNGEWMVDVCLPDVPKHVRYGDEIDMLARQRVETTYSGEGIRTAMLGMTMAQKITLAPLVSRDMIHIRIKLDKSLESSIVSLRRIHGPLLCSMTYGEADSAIQTKNHALHNELSNLWSLARLLHARRAKNTGAIFDLKNRIFTNEEGQIVHLQNRTAHMSNMLVMEIMILTNTTLARHARDRCLPVLFRNHYIEGFTRGDRDGAAREIMERRSVSYNEALSTVRSQGHKIQPAEMQIEARGHYGLDVDAYAWFTSPLRRYCDIINLRAVLDDFHDPELHDIAVYLNEKTRQNRENSENFHGENHRRKLVHHVNRGNHDALENSDLHTIIRAMSEYPKYDAEKAESFVWGRIKSKAISGKDLLFVKDKGAKLLGEKFRKEFEEYISRNLEMEILLKRETGEKINIVQQQHNFKGMLLERAAATGAQVVFHPHETTGPSHAAVFKTRVEWFHPEGNHEAEGIGLTSKQSANHGAKEIIDKLGKLPIQERKAMHDNPKGNLLEYAAKNKAKAIFEQNGKYGPDHAPTFSVKLAYTHEGKTIEVKGTGKSIKEAERQASQILLEQLLKNTQ